jgi:hypothetical protein
VEIGQVEGGANPHFVMDAAYGPVVQLFGMHINPVKFKEYVEYEAGVLEQVTGPPVALL